MTKTMVIMIAATMMLINGIASKTLIVGDDNGWSLPSSSVFYQSWADGLNIGVDDILVFNFPTGLHTVAILTSKDAFDKCDRTLDLNAEIVTQGPLQKTLTSTGQFYFFCTIGRHCNLGLKFAVNVTATPADAPGLALAPEPRTPADAPSPGPAFAPAPRPRTHANGPGPGPAFAPFSGFS